MSDPARTVWVWLRKVPPHVWGWAIFAMALLEWVRQLLTESRVESYFNADILAIASMVEDVWYRGNSFRDWHLTPAPYLWPDAALYLLARAAFPSVELAQCGATLGQVLLIALGAYLAARSIAPKAALLHASLPAAVGAAMFLGLNAVRPFDQLLVPVYHSGVAASALWMTWLMWMSASRPLLHGFRIAGLAVLGLLGALGDSLLVIQFGLVAAVLWVASCHSTLKTMVPSRAASATAFLSTVVGAVLVRWVVPFPPAGFQRFRLDDVLGTVKQAATEWMSFGVGCQVMSLGACAGTVVALIVAWRRQSRTALLSACWLLAMPLTLGTILVTGNLVGGGWIRYLIWPCLATLLAAALMLWERARWAYVLPVAAVASLMMVAAGPWQGAQPRRSAIWAMGECVTQIAKREGASSVVADYWRAKPLALTVPELRVLQFIEEGVYLHSTSRAWYRPFRPAGLVVAEGFSGGWLAREFGLPAEKVVCPGATVWVYRGEGRARLEHALDRYMTATFGD